MDIATTVEDDGTTIVMTLRGEVAYPEADELADRLERVVAVMPALAHVRVNVAAVEFMDSYGLRGLVGMRRLAEQHQLTYVTEQLSPAVARLFEATSLGAYLGAE